jgi:hypothetical protein
MRTKVTFLAGFATGYVLGSRAGRARYEQIRSAAQAFASSPAVQSTASQVQHQATEVLSTVKDKAGDRIGETWHEKRPAWMGQGGETDPAGTSSSTSDSGVAGSNGRPG